MLVNQDHAAGEENGSSWCGCLLAVCFASKKPSGCEFFVPARMDLGVNRTLLAYSYCLGVIVGDGQVICTIRQVAVE